MNKFIAITIASFCAGTACSLDMPHFARRHEKGASLSLKGHVLRAHTANDRQARYSPEIEAQDGKGKAILYLISKNGAERQWVSEMDYELHFRHFGFRVEADRVVQ